MSKYCERNGHKWLEAADGTWNCGNCGAAAPAKPEAPPAVQSGHGDVMEATAGLEDALARADGGYTKAELIRAAKSEELKHQGDGKPNTKPSNPKDAIGVGKLPMHLVPTAVARYASLSFAEGALKYGKYNWRVAGVRMSIYLDAMHRHLAKLQDGEWADGENLTQEELDNGAIATLVPHLASIIACCGIILDAHECDKLTDDRPPKNGYVGKEFEARIQHLAYLKDLFKSYSPHQHTITDETHEG